MADLTESVMADIARVGGDTSFFTAAAERANETILDELAAEFPMLDRDNEVEPCLQAANFVYGTPPLSLLGRKRCWLSLLRLGATWWNPSIVGVFHDLPSVPVWPSLLPPVAVSAAISWAHGPPALESLYRRRKRP